MNNSSFFANTDCEYYPCHKNIDEINCLFCFCPLFGIKDCGGNFQMLGNGIKDCSACVRPHKRENYGAIIKELMCHVRAN